MLRHRSRTIGAAVLACALTVAAVGCSSDSDSDGASPKKTTTTAEVSTSTTDAPTTTTTTAAKPATTTTTTTAPGGPGDAGPRDFAGPVDGQPESVEVTFTRDGGIVDFSVSGLEIQCQPLDNGDASTRPTKVTIAAAPIAADGSVQFTAKGSKYEPSLSGSFTPEGSFAGGLYLSGEDDGSVCGGEFTFIATPR
ncbi:hypothetical protein BH10ACT1_BH10ACT1_34960 [soil metagenome]